MSSTTLSKTSSRLSPILTIYIAKEILSFFFICLSAFVGILLTIRILKLTDLVVNKGVQFSQISLVLLSIVPTFLEIALPLAILIGVMLAFARLSGDSELVVIKASGLHFTNLAVPVLLVGIMVAGVNYISSSYFKPWGYVTLSQTFFDIARTRTTVGINSGVFNKLGVITLYADTIDDRSGNIQKVVIEDRRDDTVSKIITAQRGQIIPDSTLGTIMFLLEDGEIHEFDGNKYIVTRYNSNRIVLSPEQLSSSEANIKGVPARELYPAEITQSIKEFKDYIYYLENRSLANDLSTPPVSPLFNKQMYNQPRNVDYLQKKLVRLYVEQSSRWALPVGTLLLALISLPLGIHPPRSQKTWGAGLSIAIGTIVFVIYYGVLTLCLGLAESQVVSPFLATWIPNFLLVMVDIWFIQMLSREKWTSVADGLKNLLLHR
jgi:lipopolysaccharide export system permease protein